MSDESTVVTPNTETSQVGPAPPKMDRTARWLDLSASIATIAAVGLLAFKFFTASAAASAPATKLPLDLNNVKVQFNGAAAKGSGSAKVVMIEYSDFQCPYCVRFAEETAPALFRDYVDTGKVRVAFRNIPGASHQFANKAAEGAVCAGRQGQFWPMHDKLFAFRGKLTDNSVDTAAAEVPVDLKQFKTCLAGQASAEVAKDLENAKGFNISGTPSFQFGFIESDGVGRMVKGFSGAKPIDQFKAILDKLIADAR
jgi:protein-disulfide isomerase